MAQRQVFAIVGKMPVRTAMKQAAPSKSGGLNASQRGMICMVESLMGMGLVEISTEIIKSDGRHPALQSVSDAIS